MNFEDFDIRDGEGFDTPSQLGSGNQLRSTVNNKETYTAVVGTDSPGTLRNIKEIDRESRRKAEAEYETRCLAFPTFPERIRYLLKSLVEVEVYRKRELMILEQYKQAYWRMKREFAGANYALRHGNVSNSTGERLSRNDGANKDSLLKISNNFNIAKGRADNLEAENESLHKRIHYLEEQILELKEQNHKVKKTKSKLKKSLLQMEQKVSMIENTPRASLSIIQEENYNNKEKNPFFDSGINESTNIIRNNPYIDDLPFLELETTEFKSPISSNNQATAPNPYIDEAPSSPTFAHPPKFRAESNAFGLEPARSDPELLEDNKKLTVYVGALRTRIAELEKKIEVLALQNEKLRTLKPQVDLEEIEEMEPKKRKKIIRKIIEHRDELEGKIEVLQSMLDSQERRTHT